MLLRGYVERILSKVRSIFDTTIQILGFFDDRITMNYLIKNNPEYAGLSIHPFVLQEDEVYFGISKKISKKIYTRLQNAYEKLEKDGTLDKIRSNY